MLIQDSLNTIGQLLNVPIEGIGWRQSNGIVQLLDNVGAYFIPNNIRDKLQAYLSRVTCPEQAAITIPAHKLGVAATHHIVILPCPAIAKQDHNSITFGLILALPLHITLTDAQWQMTGNIAKLAGNALYGITALKESRQRQVRLKAAATVGRDATILMEPDDLLEQVAHLISRQFDFYHTGIFLVDDEGQYAVLCATNSAYGRQLINHNHRLKIGEQGMVGYVTSTGKARIALKVGNDATHYVNPFLPNTRSEMTLPMHYGDQVIGALDVQSTEEGAFTKDDSTTLQIMADQLANALVNARLHEEARQRLDKTRLLRDVMTQASALNRQEVLDKALHILQSTLPWDSTKVWRTTSAAKLQWLGTDIAAMSAVPIHGNGKTLAVFTIATPVAGQIRPRDQHFLEALAAQLSILLQNTQHYEALLRSQDLLHQLITAGEAMMRAQEVPTILDIFCASILTKLQGTIEIALYADETEDSPILTADMPDNPTKTNGPTSNPLTWILQRASASSQKPQYLKSYINLPRLAHATTSPQHFDLSQPQPSTHLIAQHPKLGKWLTTLPNPHILLQPLQTVERQIGMLVITLGTPASHHLSEYIAWLQAMANQTALILNNAQLIAQLKKQTHKLEQAYEQAQYLNDIRVQMVQNVSHELRTPLGIIIGYAGMLAEQTLGALNPQQQEITATIQNRAQTLNRLIQNLTALQGRVQLKNITSIAIPELLQQTLQEYQALAGEQNVQFFIEADVLPLIPGDLEQLHLAISHLIENAIKFSPEGGKVLIQLWADEHWGYMTVTDQGIGIATEHLDHIFDRFYQVDGSTTRQFGGMGIGLALVWDIIEAHHGQIQVHSTAGEGSKFLVALPREFLGETGVFS